MNQLGIEKIFMSQYIKYYYSILIIVFTKFNHFPRTDIQVIILCLFKGL